MSKQRITHLFIVLVALFLIVPVYLSVTVQHAHATSTICDGTDSHNYYVDFEHGDDSKDGKSPANAWMTVGRVNKGPHGDNTDSFVAGDSICFEEGETWKEPSPSTSNIYLNPPTTGGSSGNPVTITQYCDTGTGDTCGTLPILDGNGDKATIELYNLSYVTVQNLEIQNYPQPSGHPSDYCFLQTKGFDAVLNNRPDCIQDTRKGIWVFADCTMSCGSSNTTYSNITIDSVTIDNVLGCEANKGNCTGTDPIPENLARDSGGIVFQINHHSTWSFNWSNIKVINNAIHDVERNGIVLHSANTGQVTQGPNQPYHCWLDANGWVYSTDIQVGGLNGIAPAGNTIFNIGGFGINVSVSGQDSQNKGADISYNTVHDGGLGGHPSVGIWSSDSYGSVIKNNTVHDFTWPSWSTGTTDYEAYDTDACDIGAIVEYNYSHDNQGGYLLISPDSAEAVVRYNISENDASGSSGNRRWLLMNNTPPGSSGANYGGDGDKFYNNVFYVPDSSIEGTGLLEQNPTNPAYTTAPIFENNIVDNQGHIANQTSCSIEHPTGSTQWTIGYNGFWGGANPNCVNSSPSQTGGFKADPQFVSPGGSGGSRSGAANAYSLKYYNPSPRSPAYCIGTKIDAQTTYTNGGQDFAGNLLYSSWPNVDTGAMQQTYDGTYHADHSCT